MKAALEQRGWRVDEQVGCGGFRVDLAVRHPTEPDRFSLGVLLDGPGYAAAHSARDRDRLRESVLRGLGWTLARVWSLAWRLDAPRCADELDAAARAAVAGTTGDRPSAHAHAEAAAASSAVESPDGRTLIARSGAPAGGAQAREGVPVVAGVYRAAAPPRDRAAARALARAAGEPEGAGLSRVAEALWAIVADEGPITEELALRRLAQWCGVQRVTERFRTLFEASVSRGVESRALRVEGSCLWPASLTAEAFVLARPPGPDEDDRRGLDEIPLVERINAVLVVLRTQFGLPREELEREAAKLLGAPRLTAKARWTIGEAVDAVLASRRATEEGGRVVLVEP